MFKREPGVANSLRFMIINKQVQRGGTRKLWVFNSWLHIYKKKRRTRWRRGTTSLGERCDAKARIKSVDVCTCVDKLYSRWSHIDLLSNHQTLLPCLILVELLGLRGFQISSWDVDFTLALTGHMIRSAPGGPLTSCLHPIPIPGIPSIRHILSIQNHWLVNWLLFESWLGA